MVDLFIVGGGPGGYVAAERAGQAGLSVVLAEKNQLGGVCLNEGCIPSKALLNSAKMLSGARDAKAFGLSIPQSSIEQVAVIKRKNMIVKKLVAGVKSKMDSSGVRVINDQARILGRRDGYLLIEARGERIEARNLIIATGSEAIIPPIPGIEEGMAQGHVLTSKEILDLETVPKNLTVIGGGVVGLEMAAYYKEAGSQVTVIEMLDRIGGNIDLDLSHLLLKALEKKGIRFVLSARVSGVRKNRVEYLLNNEEGYVDSDMVLLSVGRRPVIEGFGLDKLGVFTESGRIVTDEKCLTNLPGVYAIGDVNGKSMLAHTASREGEVAVLSILGKPITMRYQGIPNVIYTEPEAAGVGLTEQEAEHEGLPYLTVTIPMAFSGRYMAETNRQPGMCKLVIDATHRRLLGCHLAGLYSSEIITTAGIFVDQELTIDEIKNLVFPHPTVAEIIREAVYHVDQVDRK